MANEDVNRQLGEVLDKQEQLLALTKEQATRIRRLETVIAGMAVTLVGVQSMVGREQSAGIIDSLLNAIAPKKEGGS